MKQSFAEHETPDDEGQNRLDDFTRQEGNDANGNGLEQGQLHGPYEADNATGIDTDNCQNEPGYGQPDRFFAMSSKPGQSASPDEADKKAACGAKQNTKSGLAPHNDRQSSQTGRHLERNCGSSGTGTKA